MRHYVYTVALTLSTILVTGCGSVRVVGYDMSPTYYRDCGPNGKFSPRDKECRHHNEPVAQPYAIQEINVNDNWRTNPAILAACRAEPEKYGNQRICQGIPPVE